MEKGREEWGLDSWPGSADRWLARPAELEPQGGMGDGRGHLAPIPALWGKVDLPSKEGRPRRPQPAPPPELASRFGVAGGTRTSHTASAHLVPFPERQPSFPRPQGPPPEPVGGPGWSRPDSGRCRVRVARTPPLTRHPSWNPASHAPSSPTHCPRGEGARRLSRRCRGSGRSWSENVESSCRGAGSCQ